MVAVTFRQNWKDSEDKNTIIFDNLNNNINIKVLKRRSEQVALFAATREEYKPQKKKGRSFFRISEGS